MGLKMRLAECHKATHTHKHTPLLVVLSFNTHLKTNLCSDTQAFKKKKEKTSMPALRRADVHEHTRTHAHPLTQTDKHRHTRRSCSKL